MSKKNPLANGQAVTSSAANIQLESIMNFRLYSIQNYQNGNKHIKIRFV